MNTLSDRSSGIQFYIHQALARFSFYYRTRILIWVMALGLPTLALGGPTDILSVKDYGAIGNGTTDDTVAIQSAITQAGTLKKSVFVPGGVYVISSTLSLGTATIIGEGSQVNGSSARSIFLASTAGMTMLSCSSDARIQNLGFQGNNIANIGIKIVTGPRASLENVEVSRCRKTSFLLVSTQNSCFINCYSSYSVAAFTIANGSRNNNFYNCSSNNQSEYYNASATGIPWNNTKAIYYVINTGDADYGATVTKNGNDRNSWYGGLHQYTPFGITWENLSQYEGAEGSNNQFYGVSFEGNQVVNTQNSLAPGIMLMDSCGFSLKNLDTAFGQGSVGFVKFQGEPYFYGGDNLSDRGITQRSNYYSLFIIDSDSMFSPKPYGTGSITLDATAKSVTINGGSSDVGAAFSAIARGNIANSLTARFVGRPSGLTARLTFTITSITGTNPVLARVVLDASPWRRTVASFNTPGTYSIPVRVGDNAADTFAIMFSANGNTSCSIKGVSLKATGYPQ